MAWQGNPESSGLRNIGRTAEFSRPAAAEFAARSQWPDEALMNADSLGSYFYHNIRDTYGYEKL